ncbi:hypothetical protein BD310DRAFT_935209 [Dichomitus squalens]|uniref:Uncharacterized protein n=1 Tax=Dichomitus squalens TaxID=114155 RepID=A0A4Q9PKT7_9APHY|nr:hypothetical protein BD310DRAFT_935209 [Dichomitus squalens]
MCRKTVNQGGSNVVLSRLRIRLPLISCLKDSSSKFNSGTEPEVPLQSLFARYQSLRGQRSRLSFHDFSCKEDLASRRPTAASLASPDGDDAGVDGTSCICWVATNVNGVEMCAIGAGVKPKGTAKSRLVACVSWCFQSSHDSDCYCNRSSV